MIMKSGDRPKEIGIDILYNLDSSKEIDKEKLDNREIGPDRLDNRETCTDRLDNREIGTD